MFCFSKLFSLAIPCLALLPPAAFPADLKPVAALPPGTTTVALTENQALKLENADLKYSLAVKQAEQQIAPYAQERNTVITAVCSELELTDCQFDTRNRTAIGSPEAPATHAAHDPPQPAGRSNPK